MMTTMLRRVGLDGWMEEMGPTEGIHRAHMYARRAKLKLRPVTAQEERRPLITFFSLVNVD